jgi:hypothetical protein
MGHILSAAYLSTQGAEESARALRHYSQQAALAHYSAMAAEAAALHPKPTAHTAEPWHTESLVSEQGHLCVYVQTTHTPYRGGICYLQSAEHIGGIDHAETAANAALIAAAPALLAALQGLLEMHPGTQNRATDAARAAIAKAVQP